MLFVFVLQAAKTAGGPTRVEKAKIGLIQFHVSPPKSDIENTVVISDYAQVCRVGRGGAGAILQALCCICLASVHCCMCVWRTSGLVLLAIVHFRGRSTGCTMSSDTACHCKHEHMF
jgi:hypothetical protein